LPVRAWVKRIVIPILIGFTIMGMILLASLIFIQTQMPKISLKTTTNNTIIISIGNSTITMRVNQTVPVNGT